MTRALAALLALALLACSSDDPTLDGSGDGSRPDVATDRRQNGEGVVPGVPPMDDETIARMRGVAADGLARGNRMNVFTKVGDSISETPGFLTAFGCGTHQLGEHSELYRVVERFDDPLPELPPDLTIAPCDAANAFTRHPWSMFFGWRTDHLLDRIPEPRPECPPPHDHPLACELVVLRPAVALVLIGTNDANNARTAAAYEGNLRRIIDETISYGVVPVVSTLPPRRITEAAASRVAELNEVVRRVVTETHVPLWDYHAAMAGLSDEGLDPDGIHPSQVGDGGDLTPAGLRGGINLRNLTALQILDAVATHILDPVLGAPALGVPRIGHAMQAHLRVVAQRGARAGNRGDVFAKLGDSITESPDFLVPFGCGRVDFGDHPSLADVVRRWSTTEVPPGRFDSCGVHNSLTRSSRGAGVGWTVEDLLGSARQELQELRPSIALLMIGSNDIVRPDGRTVDPDGLASFGPALGQLLDQVLAAGVVPIVSTIPHRRNPAASEPLVERFNEVIRRVTFEHDVPLWDFWAQLDGVEHHGLQIDLVHPSAAPTGAGDLSLDGLRYGYNVRNLGALLALQHVAAVVLDGAPPDA